MTHIVVIGYASMDYPLQLAGAWQRNHTVMIRDRSAQDWPKPGGCAAYVAGPISAAGVKTSVITWVGSDDLGLLYREHAAAQGIDCEGIQLVGSAQTPVCMLVYEPDGACTCLFDPGFLGRERLHERQVELICQADAVCITVGPPAIGLRALELARPDALVAWVAKNDLVSFPAPLMQQLGQRADYIFCNGAERIAIEAALAPRRRPPLGIIQSAGAGEVLVDASGQRFTVPVQPLDVVDTTGAGDALAGGTLAALLSGTSALHGAVAAGVDAAFRLLSQRVPQSVQR